MLIKGTLHKQAPQIIKLECSLGQFSITDPKLDQLAEGVYTGFFELAHIKAQMQPGINAQGNAILMLETAAELKAFALLEDTPQVLQADKTALQQAEVEAEPEQDLTAAEEADKVLFGGLWPLKARVKLDETCEHFRAQIQRLKELNYRYIGSDKVWVLINTAEAV